MKYRRQRGTLKKHQMSDVTFARLLYRKYKDSEHYKFKTEHPLSFSPALARDTNHMARIRRLESDKEIRKKSAEVIWFLVDLLELTSDDHDLEMYYKAWQLIKKQPEITDLLFL